MMKKILSLLTVTLLWVSMVACGPASQTDTTTTTATTTQTVETGTTDTATDSTSTSGTEVKTTTTTADETTVTTTATVPSTTTTKSTTSMVVTTATAASTTVVTKPTASTTVATTTKPTTTTVVTTTTSTTVATTTATAAPSGDSWFSQEPISITAKEVDAILSQTYVKPKNVILMIGDGMGQNDITLCRQYGTGNFEFGLILDRIPNRGECTTHSLDSTVTDSAAAGTALATGTKTYNGCIGVLGTGKKLENASEIARANGKRVGVVTNDEVLGATPSAFVAHTNTREQSNNIARDYARFRPEVVIGIGYENFMSAVPNPLKSYLDTVIVSKSISSAQSQLNTDPNCERPFFGFFEDMNNTQPNDRLAQSTEIALNRLQNENGFFLMVENATTDKAGHSNDITKKVQSVSNLDRALAVVLKFMKNNPDTLLLITSDHETGGVLLPEEGRGLSADLFTTTGHTGVPVAVFAVGYGADRFRNTTVDNTDIAKTLIAAIKGEL